MDYNNMKKVELISLLEKRKISFKKSWTKSELMNALTEAENEKSEKVENKDSSKVENKDSSKVENKDSEKRKKLRFWKR